MLNEKGEEIVIMPSLETNFWSRGSVLAIEDDNNQFIAKPFHKSGDNFIYTNGTKIKIESGLYLTETSDINKVWIALDFKGEIVKF